MSRLRLTHIIIAVLSFLFIFMIQSKGESATSVASLLKKADQCRDLLYKSSSKMKFRHNWMNCINRYETIYKKYPDSEQAPWAMYRTALLYQGLSRYSGLESDLDKSIEIYRQVTEKYETHRLADDAQYKIGKILYEVKNDPTQAYVEFLKVDIKFPSGDMRPRAREMMDKLAALLGKKAGEGDDEQKTATSSGNNLVAVKDIRHWSTPNYTRVVIDLDGPVKYNYRLLKKDPELHKPRRLYLDLEKTFIGSDIESSIPIKDNLLQRARAGQYNKDTVRVVLDINSIGDYKTFPLHDPFRIVVDVRGVENKIPEKREKEVPQKDSRPVGKGIKKVKEPDKSISLARQLGLSVKRIVIDPGHGGRDPGCYHSGGIREKNIVLDIAKKLAEKIEKRLGCEVLLTRTKDVAVPLDERTAFANVQKADLFISLHVNAHSQSSIFGVETYFLNMATDERAVMVAARENATSEKNISDLQSILNDLMLNTKISESSRLAYNVQDNIMKQIRGTYKTNKSLGVKQAPFYVLIGAEMPAILVETGFMTNPTERKRLLNEKYRDLLADGITTGISSYIKGIDQAYRGG